MNFFVVLLCFAMNMPYQAYYFVPLITFWFVTQTLMLNLDLPVMVWILNSKPFFRVLIWALQLTLVLFRTTKERKKDCLTLLKLLTSSITHIFQVHNEKRKIVWLIAKVMLVITIMTIFYMNQVNQIKVHKSSGGKTFAVCSPIHTHTHTHTGTWILTPCLEKWDSSAKMSQSALWRSCK